VVFAGGLKLKDVGICVGDVGGKEVRAGLVGGSVTRLRRSFFDVVDHVVVWFVCVLVAGEVGLGTFDVACS